MSQMTMENVFLWAVWEVESTLMMLMVVEGRHEDEQSDDTIDVENNHFREIQCLNM